ncbi:unnamed protein product [Callosobruchus maculatus]|uniref:Putative alpha-L-fucosidase n=1 Tax=Callosobruchus maculatus TaxID=64391 RepID=A0A653BHL2_CALMS|nr:unnamed protein product [Callosobruchus maculatus]
MKTTFGLSFVLFSYLHYINCVKYEPNWDSLDTRPLPKWFDEAKVGILLHWGVFSVPSFGSEWFWEDWKSGSQQYVHYMKENYPPDFKYQEFAKDFKAEFFDPQQWARIFKRSGARYVVLTSKHHEGYTLWPSKYSYSWNSKDVGPGRDIVGELSRAVRDEDLIFGLYHSLYEWYNPMYLSDKALNFTTTEFVDKKIIPEMRELVEQYKPSVIWSDGDWEAKDTYWKSTDFLAWLYNKSPVKDEVVVNDRWGSGIPCKHGDIYTCSDRYNPGVLQKHKWENAMTIDKKSWGFRREANLSDFFTIEELLYQLASTVSCGGNLLMNVGPTMEGTIAPIFEERLTQMGDWLTINGEAIYGSKPWVYQNDTSDGDVWYTSKDDVIYAIVLKYKPDLYLDGPMELYKQHYSCYLVGQDHQMPLTLTATNDKLQITMPPIHTIKGNWAYVLKFQRTPQILRRKQNSNF